MNVLLILLIILLFYIAINECNNNIKNNNVIATTSSVYKDITSNYPKDYIDYDNIILSKLNWTSQDYIRIVRYIDSGRFSTVFEGKMSKSYITKDDKGRYIDDKYDNKSVVLKVLKPTFIGKIKREIKMLEILKDADGIIKLLGVSKNSGCQTVTLIFESLGRHVHWLSHHARSLSSFEIQVLSYKLLKAIKNCHSRGIMHRDIKPRNVIYKGRGSSCVLKIIDLGLSDLYFPKREYNPSVASRHYKCPELLLEYAYYDYGIDIWSAGCILAGLVFRSEPFLNGADTMDQLSCIAAVVGSETILKWAAKFVIPLNKALRTAIGSYPKTSLTDFITSSNKGLCTPEVIDLIEKMLVVDHTERITVDECLEHPYFDKIRNIC